MKESGFLLTETLGYSCEFSIHSQEPTFLLPTIKGILQSPQTIFLGVYTSEGALIYGQDKTSESFIYQIPGLAMEKVIVGEDVVIERETSQNIDFYDFFVPIRANIFSLGEEEEIIGIARIGISLESIKKDLLHLVLSGVVINLVAILILFFLARILAGTITKPISTLYKGAKEFGKGNLSHKIEVKGSDEMKGLAQAFNGMAENLKKSQKVLEDTNTILEVKVNAKTRELQEVNQNLEKEVEKRTKELSKRVEELEKFRRVTVGRELRMSDIKNKMRELEEENRWLRKNKKDKEN